MLKLDVIQEILPQKVWTCLQVIVRLTTFAFFLLMFINSVDLMISIRKTARVSAALGIPYVYIYLSTAIGFFLAAIRSAQAIICPILQFAAKRREERT